MNNKIFDEIVKARKGHYCHCVEVSSVYELQGIAEQFSEEFEDYGMKVVAEFLDSLEVYFLEDSEFTYEENRDRKQEVYDFSFSGYIMAC